MGLGYSVLRKQNTAIPQIWLIRKIFALPSRFFVEWQSKFFAEKQPDTTEPPAGFSGELAPLKKTDS